MNRSGQALRAVRERAKLTTMDVAYRAHISQSYLIKIETGAVPLTDSALVKIARGLGMDATTLDRLVSTGSRSPRKAGTARGVAA